MKEETKTAPLAPHKLKVLFTVVNRGRDEIFAEFLKPYAVNLQAGIHAAGTAPEDVARYLGLAGTEKSLLISVIRAEKTKEILAMLEEKFRTVKDGRGIAFTVPMHSTVGVLSYRFLANIEV